MRDFLSYPTDSNRSRYLSLRYLFNVDWLIFSFLANSFFVSGELKGLFMIPIFWCLWMTSVKHDNHYAFIHSFSRSSTGTNMCRQTVFAGIFSFNYLQREDMDWVSQTKSFHLPPGFSHLFTVNTKNTQKVGMENKKNLKKFHFHS